MSKSNSGFSFGVPPGNGDKDDADSVDAIEVSGEPVSRTEAKNMGFAQFDSTREAKASSALFHMDQLPAGISDDLTKKLERAWNHLKRNEIDEALTLAQEVVWEYPALVAAKVIIARCFINRKEYGKALNILQAIPESDANADVIYYIALCQSRLGKVKEAIDTLKQAKASPGDATVRKRANDLLLHLQGEQTTCPVCGKKVLYDSMVEVGDQTVCANCAKNMPDEDGDDDDDDWDDEDETGARRRKKRLRPPLTKFDILVRAVFALFIVALLFLCLYMLSFASPDYYSSIRRLLPAGWTFLPDAGNATSSTEIHQEARAATAAPQRRVEFDSPPVKNAVAGVELKHRVFIKGMEKRDAVLKANFQPAPDGKHRFNESTGELSWTPSDQDAGKIFTLTFSGAYGNTLAREQINKVAVSTGPRFRNVHSLNEPRPGQIVHLLAEDLNDDKEAEIIAVHGQYWQGQITAFEESRDGFFQPVSRTALPGRPAGAGVVMAEGEKWLAVADYWNSRLRHYALRDGNLSEMAVDVDLPGKPLLAGFDRLSSTSAIVCRMEDRLELVSYRQEGQLKNTKIGQWRLPDEFVWRRVLIIPESGANKAGPIPVVMGGDPAGSIFLVDLNGGKLVPMKLDVAGVIIDAVVGRDGRIHCLVDVQGRLNLVSFTHSFGGEARNVASFDAGEAPALGGMTEVGFLPREGLHDLVVLSATRLGISFGLENGRFGDFQWWDLPKPGRIFGSAASVPASNGQPARVFFLDNAGDLWRMAMTSPEVKP